MFDLYESNKKIVIATCTFGGFWVRKLLPYNYAKKIVVLPAAIDPSQKCKELQLKKAPNFVQIGCFFFEKWKSPPSPPPPPPHFVLLGALEKK